MAADTPNVARDPGSRARRRVGEHRVPGVALALGLEDLERLADGVDLRVENLLIAPEVVHSADRPILQASDLGEGG